MEGDGTKLSPHGHIHYWGPDQRKLGHNESLLLIHYNKVLFPSKYEVTKRKFKIAVRQFFKDNYIPQELNFDGNVRKNIETFPIW